MEKKEEGARKIGRKTGRDYNSLSLGRVPMISFIAHVEIWNVFETSSNAKGGVRLCVVRILLLLLLVFAISHHILAVYSGS